jgi:hypothetical protein
MPSKTYLMLRSALWARLEARGTPMQPFLPVLRKSFTSSEPDGSASLETTMTRGGPPSRRLGRASSSLILIGQP